MIDKMLHRFYNFRRCNERAIFIPSTIIVQGQLISCPEIVHKSKPCPQAYQGVDLSVINDLAITFYYDIEPVPLLRTDLPEFLYRADVPSEVTVSADGSVDGVLFWFKSVYGKYSYSAYEHSTYARCAVFLFDKSRKMST
ncbi:unnamed protein product, partial [Gongylonema pulchrum]|uniref:Peptidase S1 domain-containing protein n=1 Tax=Gongylonema pulchrum TaxID=637853 RepID=A0A183EPE5_9BILA